MKIWWLQESSTRQRLVSHICLSVLLNHLMAKFSNEPEWNFVFRLWDVAWNLQPQLRRRSWCLTVCLLRSQWTTQVSPDNSDSQKLASDIENYTHVSSSLNLFTPLFQDMDTKRFALKVERYTNVPQRDFLKIIVFRSVQSLSYFIIFNRHEKHNLTK